VKRILVVEDGTEYVTAFERLARPGAEVSFVRATDLDEALAALAGERVDAVFLDVVFDRIPAERLAGDLDALIARFGGDRPRAERHLADHQGFYLLDALAPQLASGLPVVLAHDFSGEPERYAALAKRVPGLVGLPDGATATVALGLLMHAPGTREWSDGKAEERGD